MAFTPTRFFITGTIDKRDIIERLQARAFVPIDLDADPDDEAYSTSAGWCAFNGTAEPGIGDPDYTEHLAFGLRVDTLKIPPARLKHEVDVETREFKARNNDAPLNRYQVAEIKATVVQRLRRVVPPAIAHTPIVLDLDGAVLWVFTNAKTLGLIDELFTRATGLDLVRETVFTRVADGGDLFNLGLFSAVRCDPDQDRGEGDLLDNIGACRHLAPEFMLWLWWRGERDDGHFTVGDEAIELWLDDRMVLGSPAVNAQTDTFHGGHPSSSSEAREALRLGKLPESIKARIEARSQTWAFTINAPDLTMSGVKIPSVLSAESDDLLTERMMLLDKLVEFIDGLLAQFIAERMADNWPETHAAICAWAASDYEAPPVADDVRGMLDGSGVSEVHTEVQALHQTKARGRLESAVQDLRRSMRHLAGPGGSVTITGGSGGPVVIRGGET